MCNRSLFKTIAAFVAISSSPFLVAESPEADDKTIVITANRTAQNINDTLADIEVITRDDIERFQPESITDLLATVAGFDLVYNGGAGQSSSLFTRGTNSDHTLILIDGVRVGSATLGTKTFSNIPVAQIERIEIVKGPRAALWGSDAIGGVIQIFTRRLNNGEYSIDAKLGTDEFASTNFSIGFGTDKIKNTVTLSFEKSDGFDVFDSSTETTPDTEPDNDGYQKISAAIRGDYTLSNNTNLDWVFQYDEGENSFDSAFSDENEYNNHLWNIRYTYTLDQWLTQFSIKQSRDKAFSFDGRVSEKVGSIFETRRNQINLFTQYSFSDAVNLSAGVDHYIDDVGHSKVLGFDGLPTEFAETERSSDAIFLSSILNIGHFIGEISTRYDDVETMGSEQTFNLSAGYKLSDNITVSASRAKGFKVPTFNDLYFPGFGNSELVSELSYNTEFLIRTHWEKHSLLFVNYDNKIDQLIAYNPAIFAPSNIDKANLKGYETIYQYQQDLLSHKLTASFVDAIDKSIDNATGLAKNEQLRRRAKEHYGYELTADFDSFSFFTQLNYSGRRPDGDVYLKSYMVVNLGATYRATEHLDVKLKISDATESAEQTILNYNTPGRQIFLSVQYNNF